MDKKAKPAVKPRNPVAKFAGKVNRGGKHKNAVRAVTVPRVRKHVGTDPERA